MCAISGFLDFNNTTSLQILEEMNRTMAHRGPDGEGYNIYESAYGGVGLGHRRLSIIDLTEEAVDLKKEKYKYKLLIYHHAYRIHYIMNVV